MKTLTVTEFTYEECSGSLSLTVNLPEERDAASCFYIKKEHEAGLLAPVKLLVPEMETKDGKALLKISLDDLFYGERCLQKGAWHFIYMASGREYQCRIERQSFSYYPLKNGLSKVKPYITNHQTLGFYLKEQQVKVLVRSIRWAEGTLSGEALLQGEGAFQQAEIAIKARESMEEFICRSHAVIEEQRISFTLPAAKGLKDPADGKIYDVYLVLISEGVERAVKLKLPESQKLDAAYEETSCNSFYSVKPYRNKEQLLSLYVQQQKASVSIVDVIFDKDSGRFTVEGIVDGNSTGIQAVAAVLKQRDRLGRPEHWAFMYKQELEVSGSIFAGGFLLDSFPVEAAVPGGSWDLWITLQAEDGSTADYPAALAESYLKKQYGYFKGNRGIKIKPYMTGTRCLALYTAAEEASNRFRIAVLGSRRLNRILSEPFASSVYEAAAHKVLASAASFMSGTAEADEYFSRLESTRPDYLMLDLGGTLHYPLLKRADGTYMAGTSELAENGGLQEAGVREIDPLSAEAFDLAKEALAVLASRVSQILPANRMILVRNRLDKGAEINKRTEELERYFLACVPQVKLLDPENGGKDHDQRIIHKLNSLVLNNEVRARAGVLK